MSEPAWPWEPMPMIDLRFTDLFMSADTVEVRGIRGDAIGAPVLREVPPGVLTDLDGLRRIVMERAAEPEFKLDFGGMRFRCTRIDDVDGPAFNLRRAVFPVPEFAGLGLGPPAFLSTLVRLGSPSRSGLVVIAGSMGHGKTTTTCSLLREWLKTYGDVAVTIEDPPEMVMNGRVGVGGRCYQTQAPGGDFGAAMRVTVRRSPRYILLGEVRGPVEASQAIRAAVNGQVVITTIHANDPQTAIQALIKLASGVEDVENAAAILANGLLGIVHQRLETVEDKDRGVSTRRLHVTPLIMPDGSAGPRTLIRTNKLEQLSTTVMSQKSLIAQNLSPLHGQS